MPDQLPSAILDGINSYDSIFNMEIDTKQRFDNILNNAQKPINYPIPDFNKEMYPNGLSQDDLLNSTAMKGSVGEALFSPDRRVADYAMSKLERAQSNLPVQRGVGVPDRFAYDKMMDKYIKGDYGYNPYKSIEDNEDFNYRYDYLNQSTFSKIFKNIGTGLSRAVGSTILKLGQTIGYTGSMIGNGIEEIFNGKENNFMQDVADNSMSRWFEGLETDMKNSNLLSVFKPKGWEDKGFFNKLSYGGFWTDEVADGAAFMGEMVLSTYLMGGLGRIGGLARLGATEIEVGEALAKLGRYSKPLGLAGKYTGKALDFALKTATGADDLSGVGRWAFLTTSEAAFEASEGYKTSMEDLKARRSKGEEGYANMTDEEMRTISGDRSAGRFKANLLILSASNAFENRFIFGPLFKKAGIEAASGGERGAYLRKMGRLIGVSEDNTTLETLAKASRKEYKYSTWIGKKLDWKNSNSRLRFYGSRGLSAIAAEGFWEENAQLVAERLAAADHLTWGNFAEKLKDQTINALQGNDPEASENIGLGGLIGIGGTSIVSKVAGGNTRFKTRINPTTGIEETIPANERSPRFQGERRKLEDDVNKAVASYETYRKNFLSFQDIYEIDPKTGAPIIDADGNRVIDGIKAAGLLEGMNAFVSKQAAADKVIDPLFRKNLQDKAMADYVVAAKGAGIFSRALNRFNSLEKLDPKQLESLGFDPATTVDSAYLKDSLKEFGKIYDQTFTSLPAKLSKSDKPIDEENRKYSLYKARTDAYSAGKLMGEYQSKMLDRDFPSVFSPEAEGNTSEIQSYNSLVYQEDALNQFADMAKENGNFYDDHIKAERKRITEQKAKLLETIEQGKTSNPDLFTVEQDDRGLFYSPNKYEGYSPQEVSFNEAVENDAVKKHAEYSNVRSTRQYLADKLANLNDGIKNYKDHKAFLESIQKKDAAADALANPVATTGAQPITTGTQPTSQVATTTTAQVSLSDEEKIKGEKVMSTLDKMLSNLRSAFEANDPNNPADFGALLDYIEENEDKYNKQITKVLLDVVKVQGDIILDQIVKETFDSKNIQIQAFDKTTDFISEVIKSGLEQGKEEAIFAYVTQVQDAIDNYKPTVVELTDLEKTAIEALNTKDLSGTGVGLYVAVINDPNATNQQRKDALKSISDQLLDPRTADATGDALGQKISVAIEDLGYEAPNSTDLQTRMEETGTAHKEAQSKALEAQARKLQEADIEKRRQDELAEVANVINQSDKKTLEDQINKRYDAELAALGPIETKTPEEEVQEAVATDQNIPPEETDEQRKQRISYNIALSRTGPFTLFPQGADADFYTANKAEIDEMVERDIKDILNELNPTSEIGPGDLVQVNTKKDGTATVTAIIDDKAVLSDGRRVLLSKLTKIEGGEQGPTLEPEPEPVPEPQGPVIEEKSQAEESQSNDNENSQTPPPPQLPPAPPKAAENSDEEFMATQNKIDFEIDNARKTGIFVFPQNQPEEIVMTGEKPSIKDGTMQLKTTSSDQAAQLLRQHNILKEMGNKANPVNFWSEDEDGKPLFRVKLEHAGPVYEEKYTPWVYNTAKGLTNPQTRKPFLFPFLVAMVTDQNGDYIYFTNDGKPTSKGRGTPFGFPYTVVDYYPDNLETSRRGIQLGTGEPLNGGSNYLTDNPLADISKAVLEGISVFGRIVDVTSGKLSSYNADNSGAVYMKESYTLRSVKEVVKSGDVADDSIMILKAGQSYEYAPDHRGRNVQMIKVGQPHLFDTRSGLYVPLRGKKIKDLTYNGKSIITGQLKTALEAFDRDGKIDLGQEPSVEQEAVFESLFFFLRTLLYSQNVFIAKSLEGNRIKIIDNRAEHKSIMETELNYSSNIESLENPFIEGEEGQFSYDEFAKENFMTGVIPAQLDAKTRQIEKVNKRIIFQLDNTHEDFINTVGAAETTKKPKRVMSKDFNKFVGKTYTRKGSTTTVTVTGFKDGTFTIKSEKGETTKSTEDFVKELRKMEEVKVPTETPEVTQEFTERVKLSRDEIKDIRDKSKNVTDEDLDKLDFTC